MTHDIQVASSEGGDAAMQAFEKASARMDQVSFASIVGLFYQGAEF